MAGKGTDEVDSDDDDHDCIAVARQPRATGTSRLTLAITCRQQAAKPAVDGQVHRVVGRRFAWLGSL